MRLRISHDGRETLRLTGEVDRSNHQELETALRESVRKQRQVRVDLSELDFLDGAGVGAFQAAAGRLEGRGRLVLTSPRPVVEKVCRVLGLQRKGNIEILYPAPHPSA